MISITIEIDGIQNMLTVEQAKKLHSELDSILGKKSDQIWPRRDDTTNPFTPPNIWPQWHPTPTLTSIK